MLAQRRRRWANIEPAMAQCPVLAGYGYVIGGFMDISSPELGRSSVPIAHEAQYN